MFFFCSGSLADELRCRSVMMIRAGQGMAGTLSDEELIKCNLILEDAYDQPKLLSHLPPDAVPVSVLNIYRHRAYPEKKVRCAHCGRHLHRDGFTGLLNSGHRFHLGSKCGEDVFGESWREQKAKLEQLTDRQSELLMAVRAEQIIPPFVAALRGWSRVLERYDARRKAFEQKCGEAHALLRGALKASDGLLTVDEKVRDYAAEAKSHNGGQRWQVQSRSMGRLSGAHILNLEETMGIVNEAQKYAETYLRVVKARPRATTTRLARSRRDFMRKAEALTYVYGVYGERDLFFSEDNLDLVIRWLREKGCSERLKRSGRCLQGERCHLRMDDLSDLSREPLEFLEEFKRA